jgi:carbon monoxide dehydrogenase subunit G
LDINNSFEVPLPPAEAWKVLLDIERIAPCMPGAELLEVIDAQTYKGKVLVKLGPVALAFVGTAKFEEIDEAAHTARVKAQGTDSKGRGGAHALVTFKLAPVAAGTQVDVHTNVNLTGSVAQYGRGAGIIQSVATQLIGQFAQSLRAMLAQQSTAHPSATVAGDSAAAPAAAAIPAPTRPVSGFSLIARALWDSLLRLVRGSKQG